MEKAKGTDAAGDAGEEEGGRDHRVETLDGEDDADCPGVVAKAVGELEGERPAVLVALGIGAEEDGKKRIQSHGVAINCQQSSNSALEKRVNLQSKKAVVDNDEDDRFGESSLRLLWLGLHNLPCRLEIKRRRLVHHRTLGRNKFRRAICSAVSR